MGIYAGVSMISLALGPLSGRVLTQGVTWRAVFWLNLPVGVAMLALSAPALPRDKPEADAHMDSRGAFTLMSSLVMTVVGLHGTVVEIERIGGRLGLLHAALRHPGRKTRQPRSSPDTFRVSQC